MSSFKRVDFGNGIIYYKFHDKEGNIHREGDQPAIEWYDGEKHWYKEGKRHREGGKPAIEYSNGEKKMVL